LAFNFSKTIDMVKSAAAAASQQDQVEEQDEGVSPFQMFDPVKERMEFQAINLEDLDKEKEKGRETNQANDNEQASGASEPAFFK